MSSSKKSGWFVGTKTEEMEKGGYVPILHLATDGYAVIGWHEGWGVLPKEPMSGQVSPIEEPIWFDDDLCLLVSIDSDPVNRGAIGCQPENGEDLPFMRPIVLTGPGLVDEANLQVIPLFLSAVEARLEAPAGQYTSVSPRGERLLWKVSFRGVDLLICFGDKQTDIGLIKSMLVFALHATDRRYDGVSARAVRSVQELCHNINAK